MSTYFEKKEHFFEHAGDLRAHFDKCFNDPLQATEDRFVWDYWNVEGQYSLMRTPAYHYFPEDIYTKFHEHLTNWGRENLGCFDVSPPWLSYYVDGCYQQWHADVPHGPWAFVYSLTDWDNRQFTGGETKILKPQVLEYWRNFDSSRGMEKNDLIELIPPKFNQLTIFDPRLPHGVEEVKGSRDPKKSRLVIHGWFTNPKPIVLGFKDNKKIEAFLDESLGSILAPLEPLPDITGVIVFSLELLPSGELSGIKIKTNNLVSRNYTPEDLVIENKIKLGFEQLSYPKNDTAYKITLPLIFES